MDVLEATKILETFGVSEAPKTLEILETPKALKLLETSEMLDASEIL